PRSTRRRTMRKLALAIEELDVQSFTTDEAGTERGTVHGHISQNCNTQFAGCTNQASCQGGYTCQGPSCPALSCDNCGTYRCATEGWCPNEWAGDSCAYTGCGNCNPTAGEVGTCGLATCASPCH